MDIRNSEHLIKTEHQLYEYCDFADDVIKFADNLAKADNIDWFFEECFSDWNKEIHFVIFRSYNSEKFKNYKLSLKVVKTSNGEYDINIQRKVP